MSEHLSNINRKERILMNKNIIQRMIENIRSLLRRITNIIRTRVVGKGTILIPKRLYVVRWNAVEVLNGSLVKEAIQVLNSFAVPPYDIEKADRLIKPIRDEYHLLKDALQDSIEKSITHEDRLRGIPTRDITRNLEDIERVNNLADTLLKQVNSYARRINERSWVQITEELCASVVGLMQLMIQIENKVVDMNVNR